MGPKQGQRHRGRGSSSRESVPSVNIPQLPLHITRRRSQLQVDCGRRFPQSWHRGSPPRSGHIHAGRDRFSMLARMRRSYGTQEPRQQFAKGPLTARLSENFFVQHHSLHRRVCRAENVQYRLFQGRRAQPHHRTRGARWQSRWRTSQPTSPVLPRKPCEGPLAMAPLFRVSRTPQ